MSSNNPGKSIALVNVWGRNRGDEAMQRALIYGLRDIFPEIRIALFSDSHIDLPDGVSCYAWSDLPFYNPVHQFASRGLSRSSFSCLMREVIQHWLHRRQSVDILQSCQVVVSAPAGPYIGEFYSQSEPNCLLAIKLAALYQKPCVIAATSAGPFAKPLKNALRRYALQDVRWWTLRDPISFQSVESLNLRNTEIELVSDLVFARVIHPDQYCTSVHQRAEMASLLAYLQHPTIGITLNTTAYIDGAGVRHPIDREQYAQDLAHFLQQVVHYTHARFLFFPHHYGIAREMNVIEKVIGMLDSTTRTRVVSPQLNSDCQQILMAAIDIHVSHRYHPTIFALQQATPVFCVVHQFKTAGLLKSFDYPFEMPGTLAPVHTWFPTFQNVWDHRQAVAQHIQQRLPEIRKKAQRTIDRLVDILTEN